MNSKLSKMPTFHKIAHACSDGIGNEHAFIVALLLVIVWLAAGPFFNYSDTWQLVINTSTTIITFLIVFLIQNTQNRDAITLQVKLDELLRAHKLAHNTIIDLAKLSDEELKELEKRYNELSSAPDDDCEIKNA